MCLNFSEDWMEAMDVGYDEVKVYRFQNKVILNVNLKDENLKLKNRADMSIAYNHSLPGYVNNAQLPASQMQRIMTFHASFRYLPRRDLIDVPGCIGRKCFCWELNADKGLSQSGNQFAECDFKSANYPPQTNLEWK